MIHAKFPCVNKEFVILVQVDFFSGFVLDKSVSACYNNIRTFTACGRGGIGIRARLRGVSSNGYGFKSRRPH